MSLRRDGDHTTVFMKDMYYRTIQKNYDLYKQYEYLISRQIIYSILFLLFAAVCNMFLLYLFYIIVNKAW